MGTCSVIFGSQGLFTADFCADHEYEIRFCLRRILPLHFLTFRLKDFRFLVAICYISYPYAFCQIMSDCLVNSSKMFVSRRPLKWIPICMGFKHNCIDSKQSISYEIRSFKPLHDVSMLPSLGAGCNSYILRNPWVLNHCI